ncbi:GAF domain-containing protein [Actinoplanes sp. CA-051413]|uniref:GAF domain-containing protein n=1 Tax=Actinoplanes sp. CA-051413 TaxID=3239899 RepID=UPI003D998ABC
MTGAHPMDPTDAFHEIGLLAFSETSVDGLLKQLAELAKRTVPGTAEVSVTLSRGNGAHTAAFTGGLALDLDERQYEQGHGPCLDALASGGTLVLNDLKSEARWPDFAALALDAGCRSCLSVGLPVHQSATGALNLYATEPQAFDEDAVTVAQTFAGYAAVALANAHLHSAQANLADLLRTAMLGSRQ